MASFAASREVFFFWAFKKFKPKTHADAVAIPSEESQYIDKNIESDPEAREKWIARQLELDDIDLESGFLEPNEDEEE